MRQLASLNAIMPPHISIASKTSWLRRFEGDSPVKVLPTVQIGPSETIDLAVLVVRLHVVGRDVAGSGGAAVECSIL